MDRTTILLLIAVITLGCSTERRLVVGSKNFTEQVLLGEIVAQQIERRLDLRVERRLNLGGTLLAHEAVKSGSIDMYPEYSGTALTAVLQKPVADDPGKVLQTVREGYGQWDLAWLDPLGFDNTFAMVVRSSVAQQEQLRTLSDAARRREAWRLGSGYEFTQRPDGLTGLVKTYGLRLQGSVTTMDLGLLYPALRNGNIDMGAASATDGQLVDPDFTVLVDDRRYFPPYECALVVREEALERYPELRGVLEELSGAITEVQMRRMNAAVDRERRSVAEVAREFLEAN